MISHFDEQASPKTARSCRGSVESVPAFDYSTVKLNCQNRLDHIRSVTKFSTFPLMTRFLRMLPKDLRSSHYFRNLVRSTSFRLKRLGSVFSRGWIPYLGWGGAPKHDLVVLAVFTNEAHILAEWIEHYHAQGVSLFHLVNNGSTDGYEAILLPHIRSGLVVLHNDERRYQQVEIYNDLLPVIKREANWLIVCDLDEFIYAKRGFSTIKSYLFSLNQAVSTVMIPWKMFGSSGHLTQPTVGVRKGFLYRWEYGPQHPDEEERGCSSRQTNPEQPSITQTQLTRDEYVKSITRTRRVISLSVHHHWILFGKEILASGKTANRTFPEKQPINEDLLLEHCLHLNHYPIQSLEYFRNVKMRRGDVRSADSNETRSMEYFRAYDRNDIYDSELCVIATNSAQTKIYT